MRELLRQHGGRVRFGLLRKFGRQRESEVEDAISEATFKVWNTIDDFDASRCGVGAWFYLIARNALITSLRVRAADPLIRVVESARLDQVVAVAAQPATDGSVADKERLLDDLDACIQGLGKMQRDIVLSDLEAGVPVEAKVLAERWGTTPNNIWVSRNHAHAGLRKCLRRKGHDR